MPYIGRELDRGNYLKLDDISSSFDGSTTTFNLTNGGNAFYPGSAFSILVVLAGVVQEPEAAYQINQAQITFASAPLAGDQFFCIVLGQALGVNTPANGSVNGTQLAKPFNYDNYFYLDDANNRVGVGTATPMTPLHVEGTGRFTNVTVTGDLTVEGTTSTLDTVVTEVDKLEVLANNSTVAVAVTQSGSGDAAIFMGGNVGIGTNNLTQQLHVHDDTNYQGILINGSSAPRLTFAKAGSTTVEWGVGIDGTNGNNFAIAQAGNTAKFIIDANGKIGINDNTPDNTLSIKGLGSFDADSNSFYFGSNFTGTGQNYIGSSKHAQRFFLNNASANGYFSYSNTGSAGTAGDAITWQERLRITSAGSVGIGTNNPQSMFEVHGTSPIVRSKHSTSQKYTQINHNGTDGYLDWSSGGLIFRGASNTERLRIASDGVITGRGELRLTEGTSGVSNGDEIGSLMFTYPSNDNKNAKIVALQNAGTSGADLAFFTRTHGDATNADGGEERLRITSGGNVGINRPIPSAALDVESATDQTVLRLRNNGGNDTRLLFSNKAAGVAEIFYQGDFRFVDDENSDTERLRIASDGKVGINCTPLSILHTKTSGGEGLRIQGTASSAFMRFTDGSNNSTGYFGQDTTFSIVNQRNTDMRFKTNDIERLRITSAGQVKIIGVDDQDNLVVNGGSTQFAVHQDDTDGEVSLRAQDSSGNNYTKYMTFFTEGGSGPIERLRITPGGGVGIGTDTPYVNNSFTSLSIGGSGKYGLIELNKSDGVAGSWIDVYGTNGNGDLRITTAGTSGAITFWTGGSFTEKVRITSAGDVGIGTATPDKKLRVEGDARVTGTLTIGEASTVIDGSVEYPSSRPTLDLNFAATKVLDDIITFTRDSFGTYVDDMGIIKYASNNVPRFDHNPTTGESLGLLIEESRTNLLTYSDIVSGEGLGTGWAIGGNRASKGANRTAPDGTLSAWNSVYNGTGGDASLYKVGGEITTSNSTAYTLSIFAKVPSTNTYLTGVRIRTFNDNHSATFNLLTGTIVGGVEGTTTQRMEAYPNGWYRCSITFTSGTDGNQGVQYYMTNSSNSTSMNDSNANGEEIHYWGAQLEEGSFPTSYIPTSSSTVTRAVDSAKITGTNFTGFYNQNESTLFVNYKLDKSNYLYSPVGVDMVTFRTDGNSHGYDIRIVADTSTPTLDAHGVYNSVAQYDLAGISLSSGFKDYFVAKAFALNDVAVSFNGAAPQTDATAAVVERDTLFIGYVPRRAHYKSIKYFNKRLPNAQLRGLTQQ